MKTAEKAYYKLQGIQDLFEEIKGAAEDLHRHPEDPEPLKYLKWARKEVLRALGWWNNDSVHQVAREARQYITKALESHAALAGK